MERGQNVLQEEKKKSLFQSLFQQFTDPLILILLIAAAISILLGEGGDAMIIGTVVAMNSIIGIIQEGKAQKALDALKKMTSPRAVIKRNGQSVEIPAKDLIPGDIVCLETGRQVPADLQLTWAAGLKIEESALTGEAVPVEKDHTFRSTDRLPLGDRKDMAYMSTNVTGGRGEGIVTAIGMDTEIGKIAGMISQAPEQLTPLQKKLADLGGLLSFVSVFLCAFLFFLAMLQHRNPAEMFLTAISLAVAAVPEGLPAVVTIVLALSVSRMVKVNAIVKRLPSVETLGAVDVVCSDKTGTLTQNQMTVVRCFTDRSWFTPEQLDTNTHRRFLEGLILCNDACLTKKQRIGDPTELAFLDLGQSHNLSKEKLERHNPRTGELAFDSSRKMMTTLHRDGISYTKGAPDFVLKQCSHILIRGRVHRLTETHRQEISSALRQMSSHACRVLALAMKNPSGQTVSPDSATESLARKQADTALTSELSQTGSANKLLETNLTNRHSQANSTGRLSETDLTFIGLAGMIDPPRPEAASTVLTLKTAGVKTVMITGDHMDTALAVAKGLHIADTPAQCLSGSDIDRLSDQELARRIRGISLFARVSPAHKVRIVKAFKEAGNTVAMTGDGVNDAPSLKAADIGVAMGKNGTDVAKNASDMILSDDNFSTIEKAIEEGRSIYENIKKSVIFLLSSNFGEIITMLLTVALRLPPALKASHILWINLITDSLPALALGVDENDMEALMEKPPRKQSEGLFSGGGLSCTLFYGFLIAFISLASFLKCPCMYLTRDGLPITLENLAAALSQPDILAHSQTYAFTVLGISQLFHAIGMRNREKSLFHMRLGTNKLMVLSLLAGIGLQAMVTEIPWLIAAFCTVKLTLTEWIALLCLSMAPLLAHELLLPGAHRQKDSAFSEQLTDSQQQ